MRVILIAQLLRALEGFVHSTVNHVHLLGDGSHFNLPPQVGRRIVV